MALKRGGFFTPIGSQGIQGLQGTQGTKGDTGDNGIQGIVGAQGTQGIQGLIGLDGLQGIQGTQGTIGSQGDIGTQGIQGIQGISAIFLGINSQTGTTYTLVLSDNLKLIRCSNTDPITVTVPKNSVVAFETLSVITIEQQGAGQVTVDPVDGDVTINAYRGKKTAGQYAGIQLVKVDTDVWTLYGGIG